MTTNSSSDDSSEVAITNRSGGVDINADKMKIDGDVTGRDKIVSDNSIKVGDITNSTGVAIGTGASVTINSKTVPIPDEP